VDAEYRRRNEKVKLQLAVLTAAQYRAGIEPTDAEVTAQFNAHQDLYRIPEKRRVRFLSIASDALRSKMTATPEEVQARYRANQQMYSTPEQVRASHILFKTEGKDDATVKKTAEAVLARAKAGQDFAALAKKYSDDDQTKDRGGDLDYFSRNAMAKEFEDAAFSLQPGQISDLVKTSFGYHIIKVTDRKAASTRSLDDVRALLTEQIKDEKAQQQAVTMGDEVAKEIKQPEDLDKVARTRGLTVGDSGLFARDEPLAGLGLVPAVSNEAFTMQKGKVSGELRTNQGFAFITVTDIQPAHPPTLGEVRDKVHEDVARQKALDQAKAKAETLARTAKANFAAAAKAAGVEVKTTDFVPRGTALPDVGVSNAVDDAVFKLATGDVAGPIVTDNAVVVARVVDRQDVKPEAAQADRDSLRNELLQQRRQDFFEAYLAKTKVKRTIRYNEDTIKTLLGS
jgi:peptidyl-prolyl cis-trans isomerase D